MRRKRKPYRRPAAPLSVEDACGAARELAASRIIQETTLEFMHRLDPTYFPYSRGIFSTQAATFWDRIREHLAKMGITARTVAFEKVRFDNGELLFKSLSQAKVRVSYGANHSLYEVGEYDLDAVLRESGAMNIQIQCNFTPSDIPLSADGEVVIKKESFLTLLEPIDIQHDEAISALARYCYRSDFRPLLAKISTILDSKKVTITTTDYSFDVRAKRFKLHKHEFTPPTNLPFIVYVKDPDWPWVKTCFNRWREGRVLVLYNRPSSIHKNIEVIPFAVERVEGAP